ncbi:MAG: calcium-binding protein [Acidobacteriales bacterium]|nr:calcium-binding protein [Terriglobales bacterium]
MIEEATVDAYGEAEQTGGFFTMIEEHLDIPFSTTVLGVEVVVKEIDMTDAGEIVAV